MKYERKIAVVMFVLGGSRMRTVICGMLFCCWKLPAEINTGAVSAAAWGTIAPGRLFGLPCDDPQPGSRQNENAKEGRNLCSAVARGEGAFDTGSDACSHCYMLF